MTKEEIKDLLGSKRVLLINTYPGCILKIGDTMHVEKIESYTKPFPHLFREAKWYEGLSTEILVKVKYFKVLYRPSYYKVGDALEVCGYVIHEAVGVVPYIKAFKGRKDSGYGTHQVFELGNTIPCTEEEYNEMWKLDKEGDRK